MKILVVEDNPADADLVGELLAEVNPAIELAAVDRLERALSFLRDRPADAVLLDLNLPDATGTEGLARLLEAAPGLPVVVLTGAAGEGLAALAAGAQDYLAKNQLDGFVLDRALRYAIERRRHAEKEQQLAQEQAARQAAEQLSRLLELSYRVAEAGMASSDLRQCLHLIADQVRAGFATDSAAVLLVDEGRGDLLVQAAAGIPGHEGERVPLGQGAAGAIAADGVPRIIQDLASYPVVSPRLRRLSALMGTPLRSGAAEVIGVLHVGSVRPRVFAVEELRMLETLGSRVALVVENARLRDRRREAEHAARESERRLRRILETVPLGVVLAGAGGELYEVNDAYLRIIGRTREEIEGGRVRWDRITPPEYLELDWRAVEQARARGTSDVIEKEYLRPDGSRVPVLLASADFGDGRLAAFVIDISDRKAIEAERERLLATLAERDRRKDEFLAVLSHELRNPLAPIRNSLYLLERAAPGGEAARRARSVIDRQVGHLTRLVGDLLEVSRITQGKIQLQRERLDFREIAARTADDHRALFRERQVRFDTALPPAPLWVRGDATRLAQCLTNLLQNASKFTPAGGQVRLEVAADADRALARVRDTGVGFAPHLMQRLFEPFAQADETLERSAGGLGLGLALVKGLVQLHGGEVAARSAGLGRGAEFSIFVPLDRGAPASVEAPPAALPAGAAPRGRRVLVIEDNMDAALSLKDVLEFDEHKVQVAYAGHEGLQKAREFGPEVVLCDIGLPGMDGYEVARAMREDAALKDVTLVAVTGYASPEDRRKAFEAGFDSHLAKPADLEALARVFASLPASPPA